MSQTEGPKGPNKLAQFTMSDRRFILQDVEFWAAKFDALMQFYKESTLNSPEDIEAKAIACSRLAGLGYAMTEHFSAGVDSLINTTVDSPAVLACEEIGSSVFLDCEKHTRAVEERARKAVN